MIDMRIKNHDAIEVNRCKRIPADYRGVMGVPITFLQFWDEDEYEIIGCHNDAPTPEGQKGRGLRLNGKCTFKRILIRKKQN